MKSSDSEGNKVRLQKLLADLGFCSRRQAEAWMQEGLVTVNGQVPALGTKVDPSKDAIKVKGKLIHKKELPDRIVLAINKPRGLVCTNYDPYNPETVFSLLPKKLQSIRLFCVGRLDKESQGLLILTNDGELAQSLSHPSHGIIKRYLVTLNKPFEPNDIELLLGGINSEGEVLKAVKVIPQTHGLKADRQVEIHLAQGRKNEIRRMFEVLGYWVHRLKRIQIGQLKLRKLGTKVIRELSPEETDLLLKNEK